VAAVLDDHRQRCLADRSDLRGDRDSPARLAVMVAVGPRAPPAAPARAGRDFEEGSLTMSDRKIEHLDDDECLRLISPGGIGRIAYQSRFGPAVLPVNYQLHQGAIVFRTAEDSPLDQDLRTGIADAEYKVAFEIDDLDPAAREGWSVLVQGSAHHIRPGTERESAEAAGVESWAAGDRELFVSITPARITGRRITA
jgi:hypothetical protein